MERRAVIVTDIGYGDAGKGTMVDYLVHQADSAVVVRHNGGPQAAHNVVTPDGRHHTFAQFGSGSLVPGVRTHLSHHMLINPVNMFPEAGHLQALGVPDIWERTTVDREAIIITPWHRSANRIRELARGANRHGSCGMGVGEAMADHIDRPELTIRVRDLASPSVCHKLEAVRHAKLEQLETELAGQDIDAAEWLSLKDATESDALAALYRAWLERLTIVDRDYLPHLVREHELTVFEGAQGVLLDEWFGFHPYTTWSTTTPANALELLADMPDVPVIRLGVMRAYMTRHGAGPFVTEQPELSALLPEPHNGTGEWQGHFRRGWLDLPACRYALAACGGLDELAVTGLDQVASLPEWRYCTAYDHDGTRLTDLPPGVKGNLDHQSWLTGLITNCSPVYQALSAALAMPDQADSRHRDICAIIEAGLGLPITHASFGPTWTDKHALVAC